MLPEQHTRKVTNVRKLPIWFLATGIALKGILLLLWRLWELPELTKPLIYYDPGALFFAERMVRLFFDPRRLFPGHGEAALFELFLVLGFGIECLIAGFVLRWVLLLSAGQRPLLP